jgi:chromate reductase
MSEIRVLAIPGSLRQASYSRKIAGILQDLAPSGSSVAVYEHLATLPHYNEDLDHDNPPAAVSSLRRAIIEADALCWVFPEYNHSVPGVLKNFVDWASRPLGAAPLLGKVSALAVVSQGQGGQRGMADLARILRDLGGFVVPAPEVCIQRAQERIAIDASGAVQILDASTRASLQLLLKSLHRAATDRAGEHAASPWRDFLALMRR